MIIQLVDIDYTSSLKANKKTTFSFPLLLDGSGELQMTYIGPGLAESSVTKDVVIKFQPEGDDYTGIIVVLVVVAAAGYWFWKKRKKGRKGEI